MKKAIALLILFLATGKLYASAGVRTILVFPFANVGSRTDVGWMSEGLAELFSTRLAGPGRYVLGRGERNAAYEESELSPETPPTLASVYRIAQTMDVDWAVVGTFAVDGDRLTINAQLLNARALKLSPPVSATGALADLDDFASQLAWRILGTYDPDFTVGKEQDFQRQFPEVRLDAFENYIRGILATDDATRVQFLTEADKRDPTDHHAAFELGRFYFEQKDYANCEKWLQKVDEHDENYREAQFLLGISEFFLGHDLAAEGIFSQLAQEVPLGEVSNDLGVTQSRLGDNASALVNFTKAYQSDPTDGDFCFNLGACLWSLKRYSEAEVYLKQAVKIDADDPGAHSLLADVYSKLGDSGERDQELQWLAQHEGGSMASVQENEEIAPMTRLRKTYNGHAFRLLSLAVNNAREAKLSREPPAEQAAAHLDNGRKLLAEGRLPEAERELSEAVSLAPDDSAARVALAEAYEQEGKHAQAETELETSLRIKDTAVAHLWLARVFFSQNRLLAARDQGEAALRLDPGNQDAASLVEKIQSQVSPGRKMP